jgi:hypothetical protein
MVNKNEIALRRTILSGQYLTLGIVRGMWNASHFLDLYLGDSKGNGVQSYLKVFPSARYQSAKASASRLLKKPSVKRTMKRKLVRMGDVDNC